MRRADLEGAVREGILSREQADRLSEFLARTGEPRFMFVHVLYYLGGMIAIGAMTLFMTLGWNSVGGWGGFATALLYGALALLLTHWFLEQKRLPIPAGIMATLAVAMVPLAIFAAQMALGYWGADYWDWELRKAVSVWFGLAMILLAFWIDLRSRFSRDYAFWLYLFGVLTFWGGLSLMSSGSEWGKLAYCGINVAMVLIGAILGRRVFAVFGGLGIAGYLGHPSWTLFRDSLVFPFALSAIGFAIIWLGVLWQRHEARWASRLRGFVPGPLRELIEARAAR